MQKIHPNFMLKEYKNSINTTCHLQTDQKKIISNSINEYNNFVKKNKLKVPTLIEWDEEIPEFDVLFDEMQKVKKLS